MVTRGKALLDAMDKSTRDEVMSQLRVRGISHRTGAAVAAVEADHLRLEGGDAIPYDEVLWATGAEPHPFTFTSCDAEHGGWLRCFRWLYAGFYFCCVVEIAATTDVKTTEAGFMVVNEYLQVRSAACAMFAWTLYLHAGS